jgi:hypothetical protein
MPVAIYLGKKEATMKQKRLKTDFNTTTKSFTLIVLAIASFFYIGGCASLPSFTRSAYNYAKEKASPDYEYRQIKNVVSATKQENGDISVCAELENSNETEKPKLITLTLSPLELTGENTSRATLLLDNVAYGGIPSYWYPIEKSKNGCEKVTSENLSSASAVSIKDLEVDSIDLYQLYEILDSNNENQQVTDKLYEVGFVFDKEKAEKDTNTKVKSLVYWPAKIDRQIGKPINIMGVFTDNSTDLYYLTVQAAVVGDYFAYVIGACIVVYYSPELLVNYLFEKSR